METDEYQISLSREIANCRAYIRKISRVINALEKKYQMNTDSFLMNPQRGSATDQSPDFKKWDESHNSLETWKQRLKEYEEIYHNMRS